MTREQLEQLSKAELIEIILQQQALIEQLQARVAQLEDFVKRLTQPPKDASNSSTPPSKTRKPNRPDRKPKRKRGPKAGHLPDDSLRRRAVFKRGDESDIPLALAALRRRARCDGCS